MIFFLSFVGTEVSIDPDVYTTLVTFGRDLCGKPAYVTGRLFSILPVIIIHKKRRILRDELQEFTINFPYLGIFSRT